MAAQPGSFAIARRPVLPAAAVPADLPESLAPELATLVDKPLAGDWLYEIKFDGYRMLARIGGPKDVRIFTRRGNDWTHRFAALRQELLAAKLPPGWYDGEIVLLDESGRPSFSGLQNAIEGGNNDAIVFYLFDVPFCHGHDLRRVPVEERRALLQSVLKETAVLRFSQEIGGEATAILGSACKLGLEGVIGKRRGSIYVQRRSDDWIKLKCTRRQEFVIGGFTWPDDSRPNGIGALLVGTRDKEGKLQYAGKVGTGYTGEVSASLRQRLDGMAQKQRPFAGSTGHDRHATWVRPELVCEVTYSEWPEGGSLRHASFKGLRGDKPAAAVERERPGSAPVPARPQTAQPQHELVKVTHGSRVIDPSTGFTKLDLVRYYAEVAPWALPHLRGRPAYIRRAPLGITEPMVFQQHPQGLRGLRGTDPALWPGHDPAIAFDTPEDLVAAAQLGMVELHTWSSTARAITQPDRMIFDLDPGEGVSWPQLQEGALLMRALLQELGLQAWLKTTGGKGLHLFVPLAPEHGYETVKDFSEAVVQHMARTIPQRFVAKLGPRNRIGRIFVDYLRNGWVQSTAEAFSARARPGLGVSMPVSWDALPSLTGGDHWNIVTGPEHLATLAADPWAAYWQTPQRLQAAMEMLGFEAAAAAPSVKPSRRTAARPAAARRA
ncbi:MAG: ATP-dependent ligase LigD phosphoesterase module / ATP-dependent ligase LigD polymerase [Ramlibacter sp.]|nr:ATP-dependent ligase LigD phosphoesterase module / ATP-dependent ligase LigD polymerase [Ramlibacter sp.]